MMRDNRHCEEAIRPTKQSTNSEIASLTSFARNDDEDPILKLFENEPLSLDEIIASMGSLSHDIPSRLAKLEVNGYIKLVLGGKYVRSQNTSIT